MSYPSDLSEEQWTLVEPLFPPPNRRGRHHKYTRRAILNALFYVDRTGCQWRYLPGDYPPWPTVYYYSRKWNLDGTLQTIHDALRNQVRKNLGKEEEPSAALLDSQSVKTSQKGGSKEALERRIAAMMGTKR